MKTVLKQLSSIAGILTAVIILTLLIASLPSLFSLGRPSIESYYSNYGSEDFRGDKLYKLHFHPDNIWRKPLLYFRLLKEGKIFAYKEGKTPRNYLLQAPRHFKISLFYLGAAGIISLLLGLYISLRGAEKKRNMGFYEFLSFMTIFPDFILILLLQVLFFSLNHAIGINIIRISSVSISKPAVLLPLAVMSCYPTLYIIRTLGSSLRELYKGTFILFAMAKGLSKRKIRYFHLGPAAVHLIRGDLHKILAILFMNLFITELLFNLKGVTAFLFSNINQYIFIVNTIFLLLILYSIIYSLLFAALSLLGYILRRESL